MTDVPSSPVPSLRPAWCSRKSIPRAVNRNDRRESPGSQVSQQPETLAGKNSREMQGSPESIAETPSSSPPAPSPLLSHDRDRMLDFRSNPQLPPFPCDLSSKIWKRKKSKYARHADSLMRSYYYCYRMFCKAKQNERLTTIWFKYKDLSELAILSSPSTRIHQQIPQGV